MSPTKEYSRKPFDQKLLDQNDTPAKNAIKEFFPVGDYTVEDPANKYIADLELHKNGKLVGYIEVEVKHGWDGKRYPFSDVRYCREKEKYIKPDMKAFFVTLNHDLSRHLMVSGKELLKSPVKKVSNKYKDDEEFFVVPLDKVTFDWLKKKKTTSQDEK